MIGMVEMMGTSCALLFSSTTRRVVLTCKYAVFIKYCVEEF